MENIKNYENFYLKLRIELNCSWKRAPRFNKRHLRLTQGQLYNPEKQVEIKFPPTGGCFWHF